MRDGRGQHSIDGATVPVRPGTVTLIGRGQVHVFEGARRPRRRGGALRPTRCCSAATGGAAPRRGCSPAAAGARSSCRPASTSALERADRRAGRRDRRPADEHSPDLQRHLLSTCCCGSSAGTTPAAPSAATPTTPRSSCTGASPSLLERDFAAHHDAGHYADALAVPPAALSQRARHVTGRATKELILDRVMLEAARLLRFTDLTVGEVARRVGYDDPLYFSRAFKRHHDDSPQAYRDACAGSPCIGERPAIGRRSAGRDPYRHELDSDPTPPVLPATLRLGAVDLTVSDLDRSVGFYETRSACASTAARTAAPRSAPAARTCSCSSRMPTRAAPGATPASTTSRCCYPSREELARAARGSPHPHADQRRLRPRHLRGDLPARPRRQRDRARRRPRPRAVGRPARPGPRSAGRSRSTSPG